MKNVEFLKLFAKKLEPVTEFSSHDWSVFLVLEKILLSYLSLEKKFNKKNFVVTPCLEDFKNRNDVICLEWPVSALALGKNFPPSSLPDDPSPTDPFHALQLLPWHLFPGP